VARHGVGTAWLSGGAARWRHGLASRCGCARTRAGPGFPGPCRARDAGIPGPRHDMAAKGDGGCGLDERCDGSLHKSSTMAGWERGLLRLGYGWFISGARHHAGSIGEKG
jgi:hypothetical protein